MEVVSPSTRRIDTTVKVDGYFRVPSVAHYLVWRADARLVLHWRRGKAAPHRLTQGMLRIDPSGLTLDLDGIYARAEAA